MRVNASKEKYIFIELNKNDMNRLGLSFDDMDYSKEETRKAIFSVLNQAKYSLKQDFELSDTLRVEALPGNDGGCILFFTIGKRKVKYRLSSKDSEMVCVFKNIDAFIDLAASLKERKTENPESSLYLSDGKYYMKLSGRLRRSHLMLISEFAQRINKSEVPLFCENECVIGKNALEILCR